jgi:hypothetical protein
LILDNAEFKEVPWKPEDLDAEALEQSVAGEEETAIPDAKPESGKKAEHPGHEEATH